MAKGFKDKQGKFRPTDSRSKSSKSKTTKPEGIIFKPTSTRQKSEERSLEFQLMDRFGEEGLWTKTLNIDPKTFLNAVQGDPNWTPAFGSKIIKELKQRLEQGEMIDKPFLLLLRTESNDKIIGHQGRHRAVTARELKVKKIPVEIYCQEGKITAKCNKVDEKILKKALSQFPSPKEVEKDKDDFEDDIKQTKKTLKRLKKIKDPRSDEEQAIFEVEFNIRNLENVRKLADEMEFKRQKKKKEIKMIFE